MKNKSKTSIGLIAQKAFSVAMAWYIFMSTAFPLALLNPVKAADEKETTEAVETTVTPTATPAVTVEQTPVATPVVTEEVKPTVEVTPEVTATVTPTTEATPTVEVTPGSTPAPEVTEPVKEAPVWQSAVENTFVTSKAVELNRVYTIESIPGFSIKFTKLPAESSTITVKKSVAPAKVNNTVSYGYSYDVTSEMVNGTFEYTMTLPKPANKESEVVFSEDGKKFSEIKNESEAQTTISFTADHFTTFVVITPNPAGNGSESNDVCATATVGGAVTCYDTIQAAINAASGTDTITIKNGTYTEQLSITKSLNIVGESRAGVVIKAPGVLADTALGANTKAIVFIGNGKSVVLSNLTVSGPGPSACGSIHYGIFVAQSANLNISNATISSVRDNPVSGCQNGNAIQVGRQALSTTGTATISNVSISDYQKTGIIVDNAGSSATISNVTVTGIGETAVIAQNGIQISRGANATINNSSISGNKFNNPANAWHQGSTGVMFYNAGTVSFTGNTVTNNDSGVYSEGSVATPVITGNTFNANIWHVTYDEAGNIDLTSNTWSDASTLDAIEAKINHNCAASPYTHGTCTTDDYSAGGSAAFFTLAAPTHVGWNLGSTSTLPNEMPVDRACTTSPVSVNENNIAMNWTTVSGASNIKYQREVTYPNGTVGYFYNTPNYTPFSTFGSATGIEGLWNTRVRAYIDANSNNTFDSGEATSVWSNACAIRFDITAPATPTITAPVGDYANVSPILNAWTAITDDSGIQEYQIEYAYDDGHTFSGFPYRTSTTNSRNHTPALTEQGGVQFRVRALDNAGNYGAWSTWKHYIYDATKPVTTVSGIDAAWHATDVTVNFSCTDLGGSDCDKTYYIIDGGAAVEGSSVTLTTDGQHTVSFYSVDKAGNVEATQTSAQTVNIDKTAPAVPTGLHFDNTARTTSFACSAVTTRQPVVPDWNDIAGDSTFSHYEYTSFHPSGAIGLNEQVMATSEFVNSWMPPTDGAYGYAVRSVDFAGNKSAWAVSGKTLAGSCQIIYDSVAPVVAITSPTATILSGTIAIRGSVNDANPHHYYLVIQKVGGSVVAGPGTVNDATSFTDKFFFNWNTTTVADGTYIIKLEARDAAGNKTAASVHWLTVTVDNTDPLLTLPANIVEEAVSASGNVVTFAVSANDAVAGSLPVTCTPASGSTFPIGVTTVNCTATDTAGNTATGGFTVTVEDTTAPTVTVPANITREATSAAGRVVSFTASATDNIDGSIPVTCALPSGSTFPIGVNTVTCAATDAHGNTASNSFTITIRDTIAPVFGSTPTLIREATSAAGAVVTYIVTATDIVDGAVTPVCNPASGSTFGLGMTIVRCTATDAHGNSSSRNFLVFVLDRTAPVFDATPDLTEEATSPAGAVVNFAVTATDLVDDSVSVVCAPRSGRIFPVGTTTVRCVAMDNYLNMSFRNFTVTVTDTTAPVLTLPADFDVEATSAAGAVATFVATATDIVDGAVTPVCTPASGSLFSLGANTVTCTATDAHANVATGTFTITVLDRTAPTVPENVRFSNPAMACGAYTNVHTVTVDWDDSTDAVGVVGYDYYIEYPLIPTGRGTWNTTTVASQRTGTLNPGLHQLKVRAKDAAGNKSDWTALCDITYDITAPVVATPGNQTFEADSPAGYNYTFNATATDNIDTELTVTCTPVDNNTAHQYPIGDTEITCSATDRAGNTGTSTFTVTVEDTTKPTITDVPDATLYEGDAMPAFSVTVTDIVGVKKVCMSVTGPGMMVPTISESFCDYSHNLPAGTTSTTLDVNALLGLPATVDLVNYFPMLQEGTYVFTYWAEDEAGNKSDEQETTIVVVNVPPTLTLTTAQNADRTFTYTAVGAGGNSPLTYTWTNGDFAGCSGTNQTVLTPNLPRDYTCTVTVTDVDGDSVSRTATVTVEALPVVAEVLGENTEAEVTPSVTPTPAVLGERVCSEKKALVVTVYLDKNGNGKRDSDEKAVESVKGEVYYTVDNDKLTVGNFSTDNEGKWKLDVCAGDYTIKIDTASLPAKAKVAAETLGVSVLADQAETNIAITITEETDKKSIPYWIYILIALIVISAIGYVVYKNRKE